MNQQVEDIKAIRNMMEKSSKFLSISGLSGIIAGLAAIAGAAFAYFYLLKDPSAKDYTNEQETLILLSDAFVVLLISISLGVFFSWKKAVKNNVIFFNSVSLRAIYNFSIPLIAGGFFSILLLFRGETGLVFSTTLIFYGLALINASKYTFNEVHILGIIEIVLGLLAAVFIRSGLLFWTTGFGLFNILFGCIIYYKYDRQRK